MISLLIASAYSALYDMLVLDILSAIFPNAQENSCQFGYFLLPCTCKFRSCLYVSLVPVSMSTQAHSTSTGRYMERNSQTVLSQSNLVRDLLLGSQTLDRYSHNNGEPSTRHDTVQKPTAYLLNCLSHGRRRILVVIGF